MGPKAPGIKHGPPQESDSDDQVEDSDTDPQLDDSDSGDSDGESDVQQDDMESDEDSEGQNYQGMTMQELLKLQEDMGTKAFRNKVLKKGGGIVGNGGSSAGKSGTSKPATKQGGTKTVLKRANKNRPVEVPMMRRAAPRLATLDPGHSTKRMIIRDPRFDDLSGDLNLKSWQENYGFLRETRKKEKELLKKELKTEQDPEKKARMKSIIQRMENQERERARKEKEREVRQQERQEQREALRQGKKPKFMSNKERKLLVKAAHFEDLKKGNKLEKYLERKEKRLKAKEMKRKY